MVDSQILDSVYSIADKFISFIPTLVLVIVLLIVGIIVGKFFGRVGSKILDKAGLDDLIDKTVIGNMIRKTGTSTVDLFAAIIKWFVYFIFAVIIIDLLQLGVVADFLVMVISYIPLIASALLVLVVGLLIVDFLTDLIKKILIATGVDDRIMKSAIGEPLKASGMSASGIVAGLVKLFGYLLFITVAMEILQFTMLTGFLVDVINYLPALFTGVLILIIGLLAIDFIMDYIGATMRGINVEGVDALLPALRGFLFLLVILLALDTMLIRTSIFYVFLGPLAWGFAVVVAFRWGIKDALVAYAQAKK